jgi:hypothetical protein
MVFDAIGELFRAGEAQLDRDSEEGFELGKAAPSARNAKGDDAATVSRVMDTASLRRLHNVDGTRGAGCEPFEQPADRGVCSAFAAAPV